ncbi:kinase [Luteimonas sp. MHLX1A]|uniref:kinase n=1 Tax=Alterluteimonas muca TaxID=2878684 RepID=UPI001E4B62E1|nr:kinase [Luteimonas sp. MHLX1A]MCD9047670.1 kinase [Luteimonas sp. MHLX1A]
MTQGTHPADADPAPGGFGATLVDAVLADARRAGVRIYGISGLQGSGKSTLAAQLAAAGRATGMRIAVVSIDDFYLDRPQREALAREVHPLLRTRGPPGTHDLPLALHTLDALREGDDVAIPRFDKLADRRLPAHGWARVAGADLVVFEGWFLGTPAEPAPALLRPVNALERDEDRDGVWRRHCNDALARDYPPLWSRIDRLLLLAAPGFEVVPDWRWEQECAAQARNAADPGMDRAQCDRFVQHYERVSRQALRTLPPRADLLVRLDARRSPRITA